MAVSLFDWQEDSCAHLVRAIEKYGIVADGSDMGTGKTLKALFAAKRLNKAVFVVCPKSVIDDWIYWAGVIGVEATVINYDKLRTGKTPHGNWMVKNRVFEFTTPNNAILVWDEAHKLGGIDTQQATMLVGATRQKIPMMLLSGTLLENPLKGKAIGFALGLHKLVNFWSWALQHGVTEGLYGMEFKLPPDQATVVMESIRKAMGDKFTRIRKADVPNFPKKRVVPIYIHTAEMPETDGLFGHEARQAVELLKVPGTAERTRELANDAGHSITIFVNYIATLEALIEEFPEAAVIRGGQSSTERKTNLNKFQNNEAHVALIMTQAGGTGVNLHDLHGRPRTSIIFPGNSATDFLQAIDRINRAAAQSEATILVALASGVPVERRIRNRMESKITNLTALNDYDLAPTSDSVTNHNNETNSPDSSGALHANPGTPAHEHGSVPDECPLDQAGHPHGPGGAPGDNGDHGDGGGTSGADCDSGGQSHGPIPDAEPLAHTRDALNIFVQSPDHAAETSGVEGSSAPAEAVEPRAVPDGSDSTARSTDGPSHHASNPRPGHPDQMVKVLLPKPEIVAAIAGDTTVPKLTLAETQAKAAEGNHGVRKHARCSPSKLKNLEICPSYSGDNDSPVHPVTLRGTAMHEALETGDDSKLDLLPEHGRDGTEHALVTMCREFQDAEAVAGELVITEPHLKTHDPDVQGFADRVVIEPPFNAAGHRRARIRDYKMGFNLVDLPNVNPQAIAYTVAVFLEYPDVVEVNFAFLIPRQDSVLEHTFTRADLPALQLRLSVIADRVRKLAGKEFNKDNANCLYCGNKAVCPKQGSDALVIARAQSGHDLPLPAVLDPALTTNPEDAAAALNVAAVMETWIEQVRKRAMAIRLELGHEIPGYDLIERSAKRELNNAIGAFRIANEEFGVTQEEYLSSCKISVTQLDKLVGEHAGKGDKKGTLEAFTDRLLDEGLLTRGASFHVLQRSRKKAIKTVS